MLRPAERPALSLLPVFPVAAAVAAGLCTLVVVRVASFVPLLFRLMLAV